MEKDLLYSDSIYFIEVDKIVPNPYQPRREFDQARLKDLADSIRQYGSTSTSCGFSSRRRNARRWNESKIRAYCRREAS